jgi:hypothetical protein
MTDRELTEDEQYAKATEGNPLFDAHGPIDDPKPETPDDTSADDAPTSDEPAGDDAANGDAATQATETEPFAGYNQLAPEAREAYDKIVADKTKAENDYRALHGIAAPLQRGNAELRRQHDTLLARIQQLEDLGRKQQNVSAVKDQALEGFEQWAKDYPEESQAIQAMMNPLREKIGSLESALGKVSTLEAQLGELHADKQQSALQTELGALTAAHSDWQAIHDDPMYWEWLQDQSPGIQSLNNSMFAGDAIELLNLFKRASAPVVPASTAAASQAADAVRQRRDKTLERGTQPNVRASESSGNGNAIDMSADDAMFLSLVKDNPNFDH